MRRTFAAALSYLASFASADYDWRTQDLSFKQQFNQFATMKDSRDWAAGEYGQAGCIPIDDDQRFKRFVGKYKPLTMPGFDRDEVWVLYYSGGHNEYYVINAARAEFCLDAWITVDGDCSDDRKPMKWTVFDENTKPFRFSFWQGTVDNVIADVNHHAPGGYYQHFWEARGSCASNDFRYAAFTAAGDDEDLDYDALPEMRSKATAISCPYFEFCYGGPICLTGKSDLGSCPAEPYPIAFDDIEDFCDAHYENKSESIKAKCAKRQPRVRFLGGIRNKDTTFTITGSGPANVSAFLQVGTRMGHKAAEDLTYTFANHELADKLISLNAGHVQSTYTDITGESYLRQNLQKQRKYLNTLTPTQRLQIGDAFSQFKGITLIAARSLCMTYTIEVSQILDQASDDALVYSSYTARKPVAFDERTGSLLFSTSDAETYAGKKVTFRICVESKFEDIEYNDLCWTHQFTINAI